MILIALIFNHKVSIESAFPAPQHRESCCVSQEQLYTLSRSDHMFIIDESVILPQLNHKGWRDVPGNRGFAWAKEVPITNRIIISISQVKESGIRKPNDFFKVGQCLMKENFERCVFLNLSYSHTLFSLRTKSEMSNPLWQKFTPL